MSRDRDRKKGEWISWLEKYSLAGKFTSNGRQVPFNYKFEQL